MKLLSNVALPKPRTLFSLALMLVVMLASLVNTTQLKAAPPVIVVTPAALNGWDKVDFTSPPPANVNSTGTFVSGPGGQAAGLASGSFRYLTNSAPGGKPRIFTTSVHPVYGSYFKDLTTLSYQAYVSPASAAAGHLVPSINVQLDLSGVGTGPFPIMVYEPCYNTGPNCGGPAQSPGSWATWESMASGQKWWSTQAIAGTDFSAAFSSFEPLTSLFAAYPNAVVGEISFNAGNRAGGAPWDNFDGNVDGVTIERTANGANPYAPTAFSAAYDFEPVTPCAAICYADAAAGDDANPGTQALPKKTIQAAIVQVDLGGTVIVAAGTYNENLSISKPLTLEGAGKDLLAKGRAGAQSIIRVASGGTVAIDVLADNVTINGFLFNMAGSTTPWAINALSGPGDGRYQNLRVLNNEFIGNGSAAQSNPGGMYLSNHDDALIEGNFFNALGSHAVFMAGTSTDTIYRNNDSFRNFLSNFSTHDASHTNVLIENNRMVEDSAILFQLRNSTIRNNSLSSAADASGRIYLGGGGDSVLIEGNSWASVRSQAILIFDAGFGYGRNSNITVRDNIIATNVATLSANNSLIDLRDVAGSSLVTGNRVTLSGNLPSGAGATAVYAVGVRGNTDNVTISDNELNGGNVDGDATAAASGILLRDTLVATSQLIIENNLITGFINGIEAQAFIAGVSVEAHENSLAGNPNGLVSAASTSLNGERNWWGSNTGPTNAGNPGGTGASVAGTVDFTPWLCDGTDTAPAVGFQPNPALSPCGPQTGSLTVTKTVNWNSFPIATTKVFTITVGGPGGYSSTQTVDYDGGSFTLNDLAPGSYTISESNPGADWETPTITPANVTVSVGTTATAAVGNNHRAYSKLQLTSICSDFPNLSRNWRVTNPNPYAVTYSYEVVGTAQTGTLVANPGTNTFSTMAVAGPNTTIIKVNTVQQDVKASSGATCATTSACYASGKQVVESFVQGKRKNGSAVLAVRSNPAKALGLPQKNDTENFVSLGFGGKLVIRFDNVIVNGSGSGADFQLWETSYGDQNRSWSNYPEAVKVEASQNGSTWVELGTTNNKDQSYDLKTLAWAKYIRLTDVSNKASSKFISTDDGFDVDAIEVKSGCAAPPAP